MARYMPTPSFLKPNPLSRRHALNIKTFYIFFYYLKSGECVRLKNFVTGAQVTDNFIENCGVHDYQFDSSDKNGEGIYIGTSSQQVRYTHHQSRVDATPLPFCLSPFRVPTQQQHQQLIDGHTICKYVWLYVKEVEKARGREVVCYDGQ